MMGVGMRMRPIVVGGGAWRRAMSQMSFSGRTGADWSNPPGIDHQDRRPEMFARVAGRREIRAGARRMELAVAESEADPVLGRPPDPRHDLAGRCAGDHDPPLGEVRLAPRADRVGEIS